MVAAARPGPWPSTFDSDPILCQPIVILRNTDCECNASAGCDSQTPGVCVREIVTAGLTKKPREN